MQFRVTIDCDNDAFAGYPEVEIARLLREVADQVEEGGLPHYVSIVRDRNGNRVGTIVKDEAYTTPHSS